MCMSAGMQRANMVVFLLVSHTQSLVGGVKKRKHPSVGLASLVHIAAASSIVQSSIFSSWCLRQMLDIYLCKYKWFCVSISGFEVHSKGPLFADCRPFSNAVPFSGCQTEYPRIMCRGFSVIF